MGSGKYIGVKLVVFATYSFRTSSKPKVIVQVDILIFL